MKDNFLDKKIYTGKVFVEILGLGERPPLSYLHPSPTPSTYWGGVAPGGGGSGTIKCLRIGEKGGPVAIDISSDLGTVQA